MEKGLDPCIVFSFSKRECEAYALKMSTLDFSSEEEKALITQVYRNAMEALSEEDRKLPQVRSDAVEVEIVAHGHGRGHICHAVSCAIVIRWRLCSRC